MAKERMTQLEEFFTSDGVTAVRYAMIVMAMLWMVGDRLIRLLRRINKREPQPIRLLGEFAELKLANGQIIVVPLSALDLYRNKKSAEKSCEFSIAAQTRRNSRD
jgi:uncharacterized protein YegP (UPF0339 family)